MELDYCCIAKLMEIRSAKCGQIIRLLHLTTYLIELGTVLKIFLKI
jgi:hypothetical protein